MRKRLVTSSQQLSSESDSAWLNLGRLASVEVTSEDPEYPVEGALVHGDGRGWKASGAGKQMIRLVFDEPVEISRIELVFEEREAERTQEFLLRWSSARGATAEIVRQQFNFSAPTTTREAEHFHVHLSDVAAIELIVTPDIQGGAARATLARMRIG